LTSPSLLCTRTTGRWGESSSLSSNCVGMPYRRAASRSRTMMAKGFWSRRYQARRRGRVGNVEQMCMPPQLLATPMAPS